MKTVEKNDFGKKILAVSHYLHPYVKHRLYTAETLGVIPKNMYKSNGIIDDSIVKLYDDFEGTIEDVEDLKVELFAEASIVLDDIFKKESFHTKTLSVSAILNEELELMEEKFEIDIDWDVLLYEELDDISYHQTDIEKPKLLYEDAEQNIIRTLEIHETDTLSDKNRSILNKIYHWLPFETSNIIDLYVFGQLSFDEIAKVKKISPSEVEKIIDTVKKSFRKNIN